MPTLSERYFLNQNKVLKPYQERVVASIKEVIPTLGPASPLREACEYALLNGGKRIRPALVFMISDALNLGADVTPSALAIEFFHTASLVADDLPCMDDDDERRSKPSVHKKYGETAAILVSYALIAAGYECYAKNAHQLKKANHPHSSRAYEIAALLVENASFNTGLNGATGGQFLDLYPPDLSLPTLREILHKKTVSLFEISFLSGWLFGGGNLSSIPLVKKAASHFGMAFQLADDIEDVKQDSLNEHAVNVAVLKGVEATEKMILEEIESYKETLRQLDLKHKDLFQLVSYDTV